MKVGDGRLLLIGAFSIALILWGGMLYSHLSKSPLEDASDPIVDVSEYNPVLDNINEIKYQEIETTYHNYIVIIDKGKVVANGVIHTHECKCRDRTVQ